MPKKNHILTHKTNKKKTAMFWNRREHDKKGVSEQLVQIKISNLKKKAAIDWCVFFLGDTHKYN